MAGGHEKAECGVDEGGGWGKPSRIGSAVGTAVVVILTVALYGVKIVAFVQFVGG